MEKEITKGNFTEGDLYWIEKNKGIQTDKIKFPFFDEESVDKELQGDITLEIIYKDIEAALEASTQYENLYLKIIEENQNNIIESFKSYKLNFVMYRIHCFILKREVSLLKYIIDLKYEKDDEILKKLLEKEDKLPEETFIEMILSDEILIKYVDNEEDKNEIIEYLKRSKKNEETMTEVEYKPSITGISIMLKVLKSVLEHNFLIIDLLAKDHSEDLMLDFFQNVKKF